VVNVINRKILGTVCLAIATFLNPFGFDILVYKLMSLTNDYWTTMHILYVSAALFFGLSYISFKLGKKILANITMTMALFLNPFGYDLIVFFINEMTHNYWVTMSVMYLMSGLFFSSFMFFYNINPINILKKQYLSIYKKINKNG